MNKQSCLLHIAAKQTLPLWTIHQCSLSQQQDVYKVNEHQKKYMKTDSQTTVIRRMLTDFEAEPAHTYLN